MQKISWYMSRLRSMSAAEIAWRMRSAARVRVDGWMLARRGDWPDLNQVYDWKGSLVDSPDGRLLGLLDPLYRDDPPPAARQAAIARADDLCAHRFSFFDFDRQPFGERIDWNREYKAGRTVPLVYSPRIDYRDTREAGDCKFAWEPSRHLHLVALGRAYRYTGNRKYADEVAAQLSDWLDQCPFGRGMQWRSPLELGIRLINWVWALELIRPSGAIGEPLMARLLRSAWQHMWLIDRYYSQFSSANNHLIGEAAGVFVASLYFSRFRQAEQWRTRSRAILAREILLQTHPDGVGREQAVGYQFFVLDFLTLCGLAARRTGHDFRPEYWRRLERMYEFIAALYEGGPVPYFGDADDGYVLDLGGGLNNVPEILTMAGRLFGRDDFLALAGPAATGERAYWLLGEGQRTGQDQRPGESSPRLESRAFTEGGYYILQSGQRGRPDAISLVFDCGELGFGAIAAHGHCDALSFVLRVGGLEFFVDPGTYDYFTYPEERIRFRSTASHNTIMVGGQEQSEMLGAFLWGRRASAECVEWDPTVPSVTGRLTGPGSHLRRISLEAGAPAVTVEDQVQAGKPSRVLAYYHLHPDCELAMSPDGREATIRRDGIELLMYVEGNSGRLPLTIESGWFSEGYHRRRPATVLVADIAADGATSAARTRIELCRDRTKKEA